ncbi:MAG: PIG-L family deacetylase [Planctomycetaceae bacterium]|nr:PIG-L family deacetylase [Planctomycetaceae bacterium]
MRVREKSTPHSTRSKRVLAIAAHPDDIEFMMAGTLLALRDRGWEVHYFNVSNGCAGSTSETRADTAKIRYAEARDSCRKAGFIHHAPIANDLGIAYMEEQIARTIAVVRAASPTIILTQSPQDYMEDHQNATRLAVTAGFSRGMKNAPCRPKRAPYFENVAIYHAMPYGLRDGLGKLLHSGLWIDIAEHIEQKRDLLACHASQKRWLDATQGMDSYLQTMVDLCSAMGTMSKKYALAEGWRKHNLLGFSSDQAFDPLQEALSDISVVDTEYMQSLDA